MRLGGQRRLTTLGPGPLPAFDAGDTHPDKSGGFCERLPCLEILRSTTTSSFQLRRAAFGSHNSYYDASGGVGSIAAQFSIETRDVSRVRDGSSTRTCPGRRAG